MPRKIFISYRRDDTAASALGIGQYLEHEFGRKNVFIDIDMRAGVKFPTVLEQRLAECKVMLVLIGPHWLATDEQGRRRLDQPDDWVRLEIAHALRRNITVIPVRINGAELPLRATLPNDIQGLLDHQAASVTLSGFRHEMSGLVRDIRSISSPRPWRRIGAIAAGLLLLLTVFAFVRFPNAIERIRLLIASAPASDKLDDDIWNATPGEWVMYEYVTSSPGQPALSQHFKPASVRIIGDRVIYETRYPVRSTSAPETGDSLSQGLYEVARIVIDCKKSVSAMAERTVYNSAREAISNLKWGDAENLNLSIGGPIAPGSITSVAQLIMCNEQIRTPLLSKDRIANINTRYLARTARGDGDVLYGVEKKISESSYELTAMIKFDVDHPFTEVFPVGIAIVGLPRSFRNRADLLQINCVDRNIKNLKTEFYDSKNNLIHMVAILNVKAVESTQGSPFELLLTSVCGPAALKVQGTYEGTNEVTYKSGAQGQQKISIIVEQNGDDVNVSFETVAGGQGKGTGKLSGAIVNSILFNSTTPKCSGSFEAVLNFSADTLNWSYKGDDCDGPMEGHGTAKKTKL